ncbi:COMT [Symbiodinium natans]|uniref:catechol O-methyltransferase n=1 Tax=Symbiodinium natans TaxID=878477 RepID=A0A812QAY9_9DINO|nr:COMT [Symbiodinium natans]
MAQRSLGSRELAREIGALGHRSQWRDAIARLEEWRKRGSEPSAVAFNALVAALARGHRVQRAGTLLQDLRREQLDLDLEAYGGAITACANGAFWAEALGFLEEVLQSELLEDSAVFNQALASCWRGNWQLAQALLARMDSHAVPRSVVSFEKASAACNRAGRWQEALHLFDEAWEALCPPNAPMFRDVCQSCADGTAWEAGPSIACICCRDDDRLVTWLQDFLKCHVGIVHGHLMVVDALNAEKARHELQQSLLTLALPLFVSLAKARYTAGIYWAEDTAKIDQYLTQDEGGVSYPTVQRRSVVSAAAVSLCLRGRSMFGELVCSAADAAAWREALHLQQEHLDPVSPGPPPGLLDKDALSTLLALWEAKGLVHPQRRLLCRLGDAVRARRDAVQRRLNRPMAEVQVANAVGTVLAWRTERQAAGLPPQAATFARRLRDAMQNQFANGDAKGALPYQKDLNLLSHVVLKADPKCGAAAICEVLEQVAQKRWRRDRLWIDMPGGDKAALCAAALRGAAPEQVLEIGTACGYASLKLALEFPRASIHTVEEDVLRVAIARCNIAMAALSARIQVWLGSSSEVIPRLPGRFGAVLLDSDGSRYLQDLGLLAEQGLLATRPVVVANHVLKPGAPELLSQLRHFAATQVISVPEFQMPVEDWISVSILLKPPGALPVAGKGVRQLTELSRNIRSRANDAGSRKASKALDDWKQFVASMKRGLAKEGVVPTAAVATVAQEKAAAARRGQLGVSSALPGHTP